ncbi:MAG: O-antigen ligase family protein [Eubacterium sp.]|nr:O-antigen ligase family protein [Eubacterium sp.]
MKINKGLFYFFLLFPFFKSDMITELNNLRWLDHLYGVWKIIAIGIMTSLWIKNKKLDVKLIILLSLIILTFFSTIINGNVGNCIPYISIQISVVYIGVLVCLAIDNHDMRWFLKAAYMLLAMYCIGNLISVIIYAPSGTMYSPSNIGIITKNRYLLGSKNYQVLFIFSFIGLSSVYDIYCFKNIRKVTIILHILSVIPLFVTEAVTAIVGITMYYMMYFIINKSPQIARCLNVSIMILANIAIFVFVIIFDGQKYFSSLFMTLFHKNLQSQRAYIWQKYIKAVYDKLFIGYGYVSYSERRASIGIVHAHNQYLDIIYQSGLIGITIFLILVGYALKQVRGNRIKYVVISSIMVWLIMFQSEYYFSNPGFYIFIFLCFDWNELEERRKE